MCGHHIYSRIWTPVLGERLQIELEETNSNDARAIKDGVIVGRKCRWRLMVVLLTTDNNKLIERISVCMYRYRRSIVT